MIQLKPGMAKKIVANTLKGTYYENLEVAATKIDSLYNDTVAGSTEVLQMIKKGEIELVLGINKHKIVIDEGFFKLKIEENKAWQNWDPWQIREMVEWKQGAYQPIEKQEASPLKWAGKEKAVA